MLYDKKWDKELPVDTFKSATELKITVEEHTALQQVLQMMENGEIKDYNPYNVLSEQRGKVLSMPLAYRKYKCGTVACIGGWAAILMGKNPAGYVGMSFSPSLHNLYYGKLCDVKVKEAITALRNFLTTGKPNWAETSGSN